jgi:uncharacterized membrane protein
MRHICYRRTAPALAAIDRELGRRLPARCWPDGEAAGERDTMLEWRTRFWLRSYLRSSMWLIPLGAYIVSLVAISVLAWIDERLQWQWAWQLNVEIVQNVLQMFVAAMLSFIVFTFGSLLVAVQIASAQLTPRIIATVLLRDNTIRLIAALFILSLVFDLGLLARTQESVLYLPLTAAVLLNLTAIGAFLYLMDYAARLLRPISVVWRLGEQGLQVIEQVYPSRIRGTHTPSPTLPALGAAAREVAHRGRSAIIMAIEFDALRLEAERTGGVVEFVYRVGDFVATGETLFRLHGGAAAANDATLCAAVAMGAERTIEQDPTFAFRVIVDIAIKALSSAINDPTTAVLAIDQVKRLLRVVGRRHLHDDAIHDASGKLRVVYRTPGWDDFVQLSCREIRLYGAANFQVARRLRSMLENLQPALPEARRPALRKELDLLDETLVRLDLLPDDLALARFPDRQGLGSSRRD